MKSVPEKSNILAMAKKIICPNVICMTIISLIAGGCDYYVSPKDIILDSGRQNDNTIFLQARQSILQNDCNGAFKVLWGQMKSGNADAAYLLATLIMNGMNIVSVRKYELRYVNFLIYALKAKRGEVINRRHRNVSIRLEISKIITENSPGDIRVSDCFSNENDINYCEKIAIEAGLISDKESFAREIDGIIRSNPRISAICSSSAY